MAFVPAAPCYLQPFPFFADADLSLDRPILIDLHEVTRGDTRHYGGEQGLEADLVWTSESTLPHVEKEDWPASLTLDQARELAGRRGMRLPSAREWLHVAVGRRGLRYPWGKDQSSVANTRELGLSSPAPVGTFENGRSRPFGCYDLVGNVWEWVVDTVPGLADASVDFDRRTGALRVDPDQVSVLGGAFDTPRLPTYEWHRTTDPDRRMLVFHARRADPGTQSPAIGARMVADAEQYLWTHAAEWGPGSEARTRVIEVARRWAADATAGEGLRRLLADLRARAGAPEGLAWLQEGAARPEPGAPED